MDNQLLTSIGKTDQSDRTRLELGEIDLETLRNADQIRLKQVEAEIEAGRLSTALDYRNAGLVFHHSRRRLSYCRPIAVKLLRKCVELDMHSSIGYKWLLAAAIDRELMDQNKPQIYGTQHIQNEDGKWELYELDSSKISEEERKECGVTLLKEQHAEVSKMNQKKLIQLYKEWKSLDKVEEYCLAVFDKKNQSLESDVDLSWNGISRFAFQLKRLDKKEESIRIFDLGIQFYPEEFDLYHSLALLHEEIGNKEMAIQLLRKSLAINPEFSDAKNDLARLS